jgi:hypothetical protein
MSEFIGMLVNKTSGNVQNVTDRYTNNDWDNGYTIKVEGDTFWHFYFMEEYDFIPARKTFQEQFSDLKIGDVFTVNGCSGYRVKVDEDQYYSSTNPSRPYQIYKIDDDFDITKSDG